MDPWKPKPRVHPHAPVVALDIDGTCGLWHDHFLEFARLYLGDDELKYQWQGAAGNVDAALGLDKPLYRDMKLAFRQGGFKRWMPTRPGMARLTQAVRAQGFQVWICTTRPWQRLDNIDKDTDYWLSKGGFQYDGVLFGEEKYQDLVDIVGIDRIVCVVDDLPEQMEAAEKLGIEAALMNGDHNKYWRGRDIPRLMDNFGAMGFVAKHMEVFVE